MADGRELLMDEARAREIVQHLLGDAELQEALTLLVEQRYVEVPFLLRAQQDTPARFIPAALRSLAGSGVLDRRTAELIAVASAASQMCEHCLRVHIEEAFAHGATHDEVLESMLIAARIAESSANAVSLRVLRRVEERLERAKGTSDREQVVGDGPVPSVPAAPRARGHAHE